METDCFHPEPETKAGTAGKESVKPVDSHLVFPLHFTDFFWISAFIIFMGYFL